MPTARAAMALDDWWAENPLRKWRRKTGTRLTVISARIGVGLTAIQKWENGTSKPTADNMAKLSELMGVDSLAEQWQRWLARSRQ